MISVVVPCFNEADVILETYRRLSAVLEQERFCDREIIFVDDGSHDETLLRLRAIQTEDPKVRVVSLSRNFGHQIAVSAGLEHSSGDAVVLIDADLQDPPELIPKMVSAWRQGAQVVYGVRRDRPGETRFKRFTASSFYRILNRLSDVSIPLDTGDFRLIDRCVVDALCRMPERDRFVRGLVAWSGFVQKPLHYSRDPRFAGNTKYPLKRMIGLAMDAIFSFSSVPLRMASWIGFAASLLALLGIMYALVVRLFTDAWVEGWAFLLIAMLFMGGVQLFFMGVLGEYIGRIYAEAKGRPLYLVRERLGFSNDDIQSEGVDRGCSDK
ncbi:glycosyltransferase family 2 protein [Pseudazoarcus pumilus]|uniref:Glycosyltransferase n=1 Tax=Pseudazoarcus pumilus TaxID=2067960 RepID=A0A2I6SB38_9RHOO|nr:glycosyltransferase family 2 protein [Pseudazoarcus pumilus]AUN96470.1 glycosyltransferase [Pseudazoarcus pumilus]